MQSATELGIDTFPSFSKMKHEKSSSPILLKYRPSLSISLAVRYGKILVLIFSMSFLAAIRTTSESSVFGILKIESSNDFSR